MAIIDRRQFFEHAIVAGAGLTAGLQLPGEAVATSPAGSEPERRADQEWTWEEARKLWKPMTRAVQHVGVPGYEWQAGVLWDGSLVFGPLAEFRYTPVLVKECAPLGRNMLN